MAVIFVLFYPNLNFLDGVLVKPPIKNLTNIRPIGADRLTDRQRGRR